MSKTLFWYIFWNLLRVFVLTVLSLSGIMSFAGLLRPLTENGLDMEQVNKMLFYLTPAMSTYSLPVSALFATTVVYGRFSAENELMAMRASGISYISLRRFSIALPAVVLGLLVAVISLLMLCFIVPSYSLKVEQVVYSNIAKVIASHIQRNHEWKMAGDQSQSLYADDAHLMPVDASDPLAQRVELIAPAFATYAKPDKGIIVPREFWMARRAIVTVRLNPAVGAAGGADLSAALLDGVKFPREFSGNLQAGVAATSFGPVPIPPLIGEQEGFMNVTRLIQLAADPGKNHRVQIIVQDLIHREQQRKFLMSIAETIKPKPDDSPPAAYTFKDDSPSGDTFMIFGGKPTMSPGGELEIKAPLDPDNPRSVALKQSHGSQQTLFAVAREMRVHAAPDIDPARPKFHPRMAVTLELYDAVITTQDSSAGHNSFSRSFAVAMPPEIVSIADKTLKDYSNDPTLTPEDAYNLRHEQIVANNAVRAELHARASFALSCLTLVIVGCALGSMFRSGNFLNAFAVSFIPALLCITLLCCGKTAAVHVPYTLTGPIHNPLPMALAFIWFGNVLVAIAAIVLTIRLQRR